MTAGRGPLVGDEDKLTAAWSHDGKEWMELKEVAVELPRVVQVGVGAINTSDGGVPKLPVRERTATHAQGLAIWRVAERRDQHAPRRMPLSSPA